MPCVYIHGCETHVGQCFEGFDASVAAAEVVRRINYNTGLCDGYRGEYTLPPSVLKLADLKPAYNVQTAQEAWTYFNYFVHAASVADILAALKGIVKDSMDEIAGRIDAEAEKYAKLAQQPVVPPNFQPEVMSYDELVAAVREKRAAAEAKETALDDELAAMAHKLRAKGRDLREISLAIVRELVRELHPTRPLAILFFAAPYCPANTLRQEVAGEKKLYDQLESLVSSFGEETGEQYKILQFFPSLSDSSYLKIDDTPESVATLYQNLPGGKTVSPVPTERIRSLSIPAVDFGCYGKDAHKWTERMYKPYKIGRASCRERV